MSLRSFTKKLLFLLSLATAKRVEELHALSWFILFSSTGATVSCSRIYLASPSSLLLGQVSRILRWVRCELVVMPCSPSPGICWQTYGVDNRPLRLFVSLDIRSRSMNKERYSFP